MPFVGSIVQSEPAGSQNSKSLNALRSRVYDIEGPAGTFSDQSLIDAAIAGFKTAHIAFNTPKVIDIDATKHLALVISYSKSGLQLERLIAHYGPTQKATIRTSPKIQAHLVGTPGLHIAASVTDSLTQPLATGHILHWAWDVTAISGNPKIQELTLTITAMLRPAPGALGVNLTVFHRRIRVYVSPGQHIEEFLKDNWQWIWSVVAIPPLVPWLRRRTWSRSRAGRTRGRRD